MKYVYMLQSVADPARHYTGFTAELKERPARHNAGEVSHTAKFRPWRIVAYVAFSGDERAVAFEKYLKSASGRAFTKTHF